MLKTETSGRRATRRRLLTAGAALPLFAISGCASEARPKYRFKFGSNLPMTHPINQLARQTSLFGPAGADRGRPGGSAVADPDG